MDTVSVNEAMHAIGYSASPDNEEVSAGLDRRSRRAWTAFPLTTIRLSAMIQYGLSRSDVPHLVQVLTIDVPRAFNTRAHQRANTMR